MTSKAHTSHIRNVTEKVTSSSSSEEEYIYTLGDNNGKVPEATIKINGELLSILEHRSTSSTKQH